MNARARSALVALAVGLLVAPVALLGAPAQGQSGVGGATPSSDVLQTETLRIGPITIPPNGFVAESDLVPRPAGDFVLKGFRADLVDLTGTPVPRSDVHLHHVAIAMIDEEDPACPSRHAPGLPSLPVRVILASGAERTPISLADPFGFSQPDGAWGANYHLVNATDVEQTFYLQYEIDLLPGLDHPGMVEATPYFMDVVGDCATAEYDVPGDGGPGSTHVREWPFPIATAGTILGTGGHLHAGGIATELLAGDGELICRSEPTLAHDHGAGAAARTSHHSDHSPAVEAMTQCNGIMRPVAAGEVLTLRSIYENDAPVRGAMGINITFIAHGWTPPLPQITTTTSTSTTTTVPATTTTVPATPAAPVTATPSFTG